MRWRRVGSPVLQSRWRRRSQVTGFVGCVAYPIDYHLEDATGGGLRVMTFPTSNPSNDTKDSPEGRAVSVLAPGLVGRRVALAIQAPVQPVPRMQRCS